MLTTVSIKGRLLISLMLVALMLFPAAALANTGPTFNNPIAPGDFPDPTVYKHTDGYYYFSYTDSGSINLNRSSTLTGVQQGVSKVVLAQTPGTGYADRLWASEIQFINGVWYIYFCADDGASVTNHRLFVISNSSPNPLEGTWTTPVKLFDPAHDYYAIDPAILNQNGNLYLLYSGSPTPGTTGPQNIYILKMSSPTSVTGNRVSLAAPGAEDAGVNEAPSVYRKNGRFFVTFSGNTFNSNDYHLDMLTAEDTADVMSPSSWTRTNNVFVKSAANGVYGPGSNAIVESPDGTEDWLVYHGCRDNRCSTWRPTFAQKIAWNPDGTPSFGAPVGTTTLLNVPSGEIGSSPLLVNAGFEYDGGPTSTPKGWSLSGANPEAIATSGTGGNKSGSYHLEIAKSSAYQAAVGQTVLSLPNGVYTLSAWVKSSGGQGSAYLEAKNYGGAARQTAIPAASTWTNVQIADIQITNGKLDIGVYSSGPAGTWLHVDDVMLARTKDTYRASADFSNYQSIHQWFYQEQVGANYLNMTWEWQANKWVGSNPYTLIWGPAQMHPDNNNSVRTWEAPKSGTVLVSGNVRKTTAGGDGVNVKIMRNDTQVWPSSGWQPIAGNDTTGFDHSAVVQVTAGDRLHFVVNKNGDNSFDEVTWDPAISYSWWKASANFATTQGGGGWYYQNGADYANMTWDAARNAWVGAHSYNLIWSPSQLHPDTNDTTLTWQAPKAGQIRIAGVARMVGAGGDGVKVKIMRNGTQIWPSSGWQSIAGGNTTGIKQDLMTTVSAGDRIRFVVNRNGNKDFDETHWDPSIYYTNP
ncbi:hypothetical protein PA598K_00708 [Paenibacillus sp. 598K]|uniref:family 43 glycosylhydrolase n=1 Tax=Paenibacillus sp. 598K TaxID=1117987 RepID=UPI000FFA667F|nr:family 43 glycosylhydrolase [Paenibacillus sp. 598K]GBF72454.1 hypothetical protein PA598K_00708 [Paenibacillus sp. 598K]